MTKRVLVTGGQGFIGRETLPFLRERGFEVHVVGRSQCDLLTEGCEALLAELRPTHLLHLAWTAEPGKFWSSPENLDWVAASLRLVRAFAANGGERAVLAGSCAEYDWSAPLLDETATPLNPHTLYGEAKAALFRLTSAAAGPLGLSLAWGRVFFPYGPQEKPGRLLSSVIDGLASGQEVACSEGLQQRDFMHVTDLGRAFVELLDSKVEGPVNLASGETLPVRELALTAARILDGEHLLRFGARPTQPGEPSRMEAAVRRLREEVGFVSRISLEEGVRRTVAERLA